MEIKNLHNLIKNSNMAINLVLEKINEFEEYFDYFKKEDESNKKLFNSFLEEYNHEKIKSESINYKFLDLFENLMNENSNNKNLINNLELKISELEQKINFNHEQTIKLINKSNNEFIDSNNSLRDDFDDNFKKLSNQSLKNNNLINSSLDKQLVEINKFSVSQRNFIDKYLQNQNYIKIFEDLIKEDSFNKELINNLWFKISELSNRVVSNHDELVNLNDSLRNDLNISVKELDNLSNRVVSNHDELVNLNDSLRDDLNNKILQNQNDINKLIEPINISNNASKLFIQNYNLHKKYFFNNQEKILKNYLNTDILFKLCYFSNIQFLSYSPSENRILLKTDDNIILQTNNRFFTIMEVIGFNGYSVPQLYQFDDFVVFDIGMNRAYASLRFAVFDNCSAVYSFEIDEDTYNKGLENIKLNPYLSKKIHTYNFGLSNKEDTTKLFYLNGADGLNTIIPDLIEIQNEFIENKDKIQSKNVKIKRTSEVIANIIENDKIQSNIVLKIDTEGSEYDIVDDLIDSGLIYEIDLIVGEGHKFNNRDISDDLLKLGFKEIDKTDNGIVYSFAYVNEKYYNIWPLKK